MRKLVILLLLCICCTCKKTQNTEIITVDVNESSNNKTSVLISPEKIVQLDSNINNFVGEIRQVSYFHHDIKKRKAFFCFNDTGNLIFRLEVGEAPGEMFGPGFFLIDSLKNEIIVNNYCLFQKYTYDGKYLNSISSVNYGLPFRCFIRLDDKSFLFQNQTYLPSFWKEYEKTKNRETKMKIYDMMVFSDDFKTLKAYHLPINNRYKYEPQRSISNYKGHVLFLSPNDYNIYEFYNNNQSIRPKYKVDFGKYNLTEEELLGDGRRIGELVKRKERAAFFTHLFESEKFVAFSYFVGEEPSYVLCSKKNKKSYHFDQILNENNLPKGEPVEYLGNDKFIISVAPEDYIEFYENGKNLPVNAPKGITDKSNLIFMTVKIEEKE